MSVFDDFKAPRNYLYESTDFDGDDVAVSTHAHVLVGRWSSSCSGCGGNLLTTDLDASDPRCGDCGRRLIGAICTTMTYDRETGKTAPAYCTTDVFPNLSDCTPGASC